MGYNCNNEYVVPGHWEVYTVTMTSVSEDITHSYTLYSQQDFIIIWLIAAGIKVLLSYKLRSMTH